MHQNLNSRMDEKVSIIIIMHLCATKKLTFTITFNVVRLISYYRDYLVLFSGWKILYKPADIVAG